MHAPGGVASEAIQDEVQQQQQQEEEEEWIQDEMQESAKKQDMESKTNGWILIPKECWEDKDEKAINECDRCGSGKSPGGY